MDTDGFSKQKHIVIKPKCVSGQTALLTPSSRWPTATPPSAAPSHSDAVVLRRGRGGTGPGGDLAEPLEPRSRVSGRWMVGWMDGCREKRKGTLKGNAFESNRQMKK